MTPSAASLLMFGVWITDPWNPTSLQPRSSITVSTMLGGLEPFAVSKTTAIKRKANQKKRIIAYNDYRSALKAVCLYGYISGRAVSAVCSLKVGARDYHVILSNCYWLSHPGRFPLILVLILMQPAIRKREKRTAWSQFNFIGKWIFFVDP